MRIISSLAHLLALAVVHCTQAIAEPSQEVAVYTPAVTLREGDRLDTRGVTGAADMPPSTLCPRERPEQLEYG